MNANNGQSRRNFLASAAALGAMALGARAWGAAPSTARIRSAELGENGSLGDRALFPPDNAWNRDISRDAIDPNSDALVASIGLDRKLHPDFGSTWNGAAWGIPYVVVAGDQPKVPVKFEYAGESDPGPYPVPPDAPIEGGAKSDGDRHVLIVDRDNWKLYELFSAYPEENGKRWRAGSGAIFDLSQNIERPAGWTSADAAGLPILPGLVRYDEAAERKKISHALRFTVQKSRRAYVPPARHSASHSNEKNLPPMGMRVRLKKDVNLSHFGPTAQVILEALQTYGMILADNGGNWFLSGAPHPKWNDQEIDTLKKIRGKDFEVVQMGAMAT